MNPAVHQTETRTINVVIAALGGEGGGVFSNWLIDVAEANHWLSQTTSLAGVAQRTGATIYYLELFPREQAGSNQPVMSLFPAQGDIDIAISSEIAEAGRMLQRGFVTPERTTLISSTHRVFGITEKIDLGDGTMDPEEVIGLADNYAKRFIRYDMMELAKIHNSVISSVLLGSLAGSGCLPFPKSSYEDVIRHTGKAVETNLAAFEASYQKAVSTKEGRLAEVGHFEPNKEVPETFVLPEGTTKQGQQLLERLKTEFPADVHELACQGLIKTLEYQDYAYGHEYLDKLARFVDLSEASNQHQLLQTLARYLALWMCFEDIPRVAQLKTRLSRMDEVREEVKAEADQIFYVTEYFNPRVEEICAILPAGLGKSMLNSKFCYRMLNLFAGGKKLNTNTLFVYFSLRLLASLRRFRRHTLGYQHEQGMINQWLNAVAAQASHNPAAALELAECGRMVKGYGKTRERTSTQLMAITQRATEQTQQPSKLSDLIRELREAALADDDNQAFNAALAKYAS